MILDMFQIDADRKITYGADEGTGTPFVHEKQLLAVADQLMLSREDLEDIWNGFAGVVPFDNLKPVKKFRNRPYGVARIWRAIQRLVPADEMAAPQPANPTKKRKARKLRAEPEPTELPTGDKNTELIRLIRRERGASLEELMEKLGWQRHTVRGRISTLGSKHGLTILSEKTASRGRVYRAA